MTPWSFCRSMICTPGLEPSRFEHGFEAGADSVHLDLEDSVPMERKDKARRDVTEFLAHRAGNRLWAVRLNSLKTPEGLHDVMALLETNAKPSLLIFTKVESSYEVEMVHKIFAARGKKIDTAAVVETARGMANISEIAKAPSMRMIIFGAADFSLDLSMEFSWKSMEQARFQTVLAAASANIVATDSPYFRIGDLEGLKRECKDSRGMGFTCKIALHPNQVPEINRTFGPSPRSVEEAKRIIEANIASKNGITMANGRMVGPPFVKMAERVLEMHRNQN